MKPLTREWVEKGEGDRNTARRELRVRKSPNFDAVCFHAQQCAEKYLKALLQERGAAIPRTHNLEALARPCCRRIRYWPRSPRACVRSARTRSKPVIPADRAIAPWHGRLSHTEAVRKAARRILGRPG